MPKATQNGRSRATAVTSNRHATRLVFQRVSKPNAAEYAGPTIAPCETLLRGRNSRFCMALKFWRASSQRRPDLLGVVAAFSVGVVLRQVSGVSRSARARHYLAAGTLGPGLRRPAWGWRSGWERAGLRCRRGERAGGRGQAGWQQRSRSRWAGCYGPRVRGSWPRWPGSSR